MDNNNIFGIDMNMDGKKDVLDDLLFMEVMKLSERDDSGSDNYYYNNSDDDNDDSEDY